MKTYDNTNQHNYCLILAGGKGRRLWPASREEKPKQFIDFLGAGRTLLQQTYDRFARFIPKDNIYVSTHADYVALVSQQLPDLDQEHLLTEPIRRNTAPIVAWAAHRINLRDQQAAFIVTPSDQFIHDEQTFQQDIISGLSHARQHNCLLTLGIRPTRPEPGYGYIQMGDPTSPLDEQQHVYPVKSFTEKPETSFAEMFIDSGEFLWNTGLLITTNNACKQAFSNIMPSVMRSLDEETQNPTWQQEESWVEQHYTMYPNMSLETAVLERSSNTCVKECHFGWADIGSWHGIYESMRSAPGDNVTLQTDAMLSDSQGNIVSLPSGHTAVINGLNNFIVVEQGDVLLITPRNDTSSQLVKSFNQWHERSKNEP